MLWILVFVMCVVASISPAAVEYDDYTDILDNPRPYEDFINCQKKKNCEHKRVSEVEKEAQAALKSELSGEGRSWSFEYIGGEGLVIPEIMPRERVNRTVELTSTERVSKAVNDKHTSS